MNETLESLYTLICDRKNNPQEGSYTCYLFDQGLDKILKKMGEECAETIIAAKNGDNAQTVMELADLLYHMLVMMAAQDLDLTALTVELEARRAKIGNLKAMRNTDRNS